MKIFLVSHDPAYASITADYSNGATDMSDLRGDAIHDFRAPVCRLTDSNSKIGNFLFLNETALVFSKDTDVAMGEFFEYGGRIHWLHVDGVGTLGILNIEEICNPINKKESEWVVGSWQKTIEMNKLVFHKSRISTMSGLFKIPELDYRPILTSTRTSSDSRWFENDFYEKYHDLGMTGLRFIEIWSD